MSTNPIIVVESDVVPKYSTHWHLRLSNVVNEKAFMDRLADHFASGYLTYYIACRSIEGIEQVPHMHIALGTVRSIKNITLARKLGLGNKTTMKEICFSYYLSGVYSDSTPERNIEYVKKDHDLIEEKGIVANLYEKIKEIGLIFQ